MSRRHSGSCCLGFGTFCCRLCPLSNTSFCDDVLSFISCGVWGILLNWVCSLLHVFSIVLMRSFPSHVVVVFLCCRVLVAFMLSCLRVAFWLIYLQCWLHSDSVLRWGDSYYRLPYNVGFCRWDDLHVHFHIRSVFHVLSHHLPTVVYVIIR